jgi:hypothetical protein
VFTTAYDKNITGFLMGYLDIGGGIKLKSTYQFLAISVNFSL